MIPRGDEKLYFKMAEHDTVSECDNCVRPYFVSTSNAEKILFFCSKGCERGKRGEVRNGS